ncbi:MAG TPA: hypothetical protein VJT70_10150 [Sphingomicrobium sp.]|nr:hypothetical protein [Sphingomicrobium sp.]
MVAPAQPIITMSEAQAYVRIETGEEEALLAGLIRTSSGLCEAFINQVVIARDFEVDVPASSAWERLPLTPIRSMTGVSAVDSNGVATALASSDFNFDIDFNGDGWVRVAQPGSVSRLRVIGRAGMADDENGVPEPIRQGVLRLIAHLFTSRDGADGEPPAAVTALWRPYRRMRLS